MKILSIPANIFIRLRLWLRILQNVSGASLKMQLGMILSAFIDILLNTVTSSPINPKVYISGVIYAKSYGVYFYVRGFSDDLYSVMPGREGDVNKLILSCLKNGDIFIDVGANIGYYSILVGKIVGENGQVIAVEPIPSTAKVLNYNIKINKLKNVKVFQKAAWNNNQIITMHIPKGFFGMASVHKLPRATDLIVVKGVHLDTILEVPKVDLLKIDAEGSEYQVLKGARKTLRKTRFLILEASFKKEEIIHFLREEQFKIRKMKFTTYIFAYKS